MFFSSLSQRRSASQLASRVALSSVVLPALLLVGGCNSSVESGISSRDMEVSSTPSDSSVTDTPSMSGTGESIANTPLVVPTQEPAALPEAPKTLGIGDTNPGLHIAKWVKGDPIDEPLKGKVHVVEFWATWCGPCRVGMPHISTLQSEYGDEVAFIGVTREDEAKVSTFLEAESPDGRTWQEVIQYRLALDDRDWTNAAYMRAASQNGIPCAFVVGREGVVEWIGHPASIDEPLKQIVDGNWDREAAIVSFKKEQRLKEMSSKLAALTRAKDWDGALGLLEEMEGDVGTSQRVMQTKLSILENAGRTEEASVVRAQVVETAWDDAATLNQFAWATATRPNSPDLELALKAAQRASELKENKDATILDTLARCYFELGKLDEAIKWQQLAVENNNGNGEIDEALKMYLAEKAKSEPAEKPAADEAAVKAEAEGETNAEADKEAEKEAAE